MSLNKTLDRLFDEIRREARRNPEFADRLDAVMRAHASRRDVSDEVLAAQEAESEAPIPPPQPKPIHKAEQEPSVAPRFNPVGLYQREGEEALSDALAALDQSALLRLIGEHHLDPVGASDGLERDALLLFIASQAKKRVERDRKLFDY